MRRLQLDGFTNMINVHTNSICCVDLISVSIVVMHGEIVEVPRDVVCGTEVCVPIIVKARG
jgi:hypothetical protein